LVLAAFPVFNASRATSLKLCIPFVLLRNHSVNRDSARYGRPIKIKRGPSDIAFYNCKILAVLTTATKIFQLWNKGILFITTKINWCFVLSRILTPASLSERSRK